jgi:predicted amidohydrolase YtcJ
VPTLYRNGRIQTGDGRTAGALAVDGARVAWIGDDDGIGPYAGTDVVDLDGALVTPAFVDAHVHTTATGLGLTGLDLSGAASLADALALVERAARAGRGRPLVGGGWDDTRWPEARPPRRAELDRAAYGGSVYLARVDAHSAVVSSALAAAAGLAAEDRPLTGAEHDHVRTAAYAGLTAGQVREAQLAALRHAASLGIACVHEMAGPAISSEDDLLSLLALAGADALPQVIAYWGELGAVDKAARLGAVGAAGDLFCDGSLGSHTAALREPYADAPQDRGELRFDTAQLAEHIAACDAAGMQAGFHAIGDAAVDQVLDAMDLIAENRAGPPRMRHRIEHAEMVRAPQRLAASGLIASMQPMFDALWGGPSGMYAQRLGAGRARGLNRFAQLAAAGVPLVFGSDTPVTPLGPWAAVRAAAYPTDPGAAISPQAAFAAHTRAGWSAAGRDGEGVLVAGAPATFAVWDDSGTAQLPDLAPGAVLPACVRTVSRGRTLFPFD